MFCAHLQCIHTKSGAASKASRDVLVGPLCGVVSDCRDTWLAAAVWFRVWRPKSSLNLRCCTNPRWKLSPSVVHCYFLENIFKHLSSGCSLVTWRQSNDWFGLAKKWLGLILDGKTHHFLVKFYSAPKSQDKSQTSLCVGPVNYKKLSQRLFHGSLVRYDKQKAKMPFDSLARVCDTGLCSDAIFWKMVPLVPGWGCSSLAKWRFAWMGIFLHLQPQLRRLVSRCFLSLCWE